MASKKASENRSISGAYKTPQSEFPVQLRLDRNEGRLPPGLAREFWTQAESAMNRYPDTSELASLIALLEGVDADRVLVTAGGDDALNRICQAFLSVGDEMVLPVPTFEMLERYCLLAGGRPVCVPWSGDAFPLDAVAEKIGSRSRLVAVVSPNNPTGSVITEEQLLKLANQNPEVTFIVDLAYTEFAGVDLTPIALELPNAIVVKTFSKAWGMAGLRVGYAIAHPETIERLRAVGNPYSVTGLSAAIVCKQLSGQSDWMNRYVERIRVERERLTAWFRERAVTVRSSQANFVLASFGNAEAVWLDLARQGIAVRRFERPAELESSLRITLPGSEEDYEILEQSLANCDFQPGTNR